MEKVIEGNPFEETARLLTGTDTPDYGRINLEQVAIDTGLAMETLQNAIYDGKYPGHEADKALDSFNIRLREQIAAGGNTKAWLKNKQAQSKPAPVEKKPRQTRQKKTKADGAASVGEDKAHEEEAPDRSVRDAERHGSGLAYPVPHIDADLVLDNVDREAPIEDDGIEIITSRNNRPSMNVAAWTRGIDNQDSGKLTLESLKKRLHVKGVARRWLDESPVLSKALKNHLGDSHPQLDAAVANGELPDKRILGIKPLRLARILHCYEGAPLEARLEPGEMEKLQRFCALPGRFSANDASIAR